MTTKNKTTINLIDPMLESVIREYHAVKAARRSLDKREESLKSEMVKMLSPYRDEYLDEDTPPWFNFGGAEVRPTDSIGSPRISETKLRERGVDPAIIGYATSRTPSTRYDTNIQEG